MEVLANGLKLFYTDNQRNHVPVIVFIHGFPFDHSMWQSQVVLLESSCRVITYDQRGHGLSTVGDGQYAFEFFVDDLFALLDGLGVEHAILCGLSMGGYVALRARERQPDRFRGLLLCDTRSEADSNEVKLKRAASVKMIHEQGVSSFVEGFLKAIFAPVSFIDKPEVVDSIRQVMLRNTPQGLCGTLIALATRTDTSDSLSAIRVPTLILVGESDTITPPSAAKSLHECIPKSEMHIIPKAAHMSNLEGPDNFNRHLTRFLHLYG